MKQRPYRLFTQLSKLATGNLPSIVPIAIIVGSPFMGYLSDKVFSSSSSTLFLDFRDGPHVFMRVYEGEYGKRAKV